MHGDAVTLRGNINGGLASALLTIPLAIGFGLFAFDPLGERYASFGVLAGLYSAIIVPLVAVLLRQTTAVVFAPRSMAAYLISAVLVHMVNSEFAKYLEASHQTLALVFLVIFAAGVFQVLFGALRLGDLVKYIPHPVIAGFQNGAAVLLLLSQIDAAFGFRNHVPILRVGEHWRDIQPLTLLVAALTCVTMMHAGRITKRIPAVIVGMTAGLAAYYGLLAAGFGLSLGPIIGEINFILPDLHYLAEFPQLLVDPQLQGLAPLVLAWSGSLALIASLDALLCAKVMEGITRQKSDHNQDLVRLGIGNTVGALFGAITSAVSLTSSQANYGAGGRTRLSVLVNAILIVASAYLFTGLIALLPRVVIASMLIVTALRLFDRWTLQLTRQVATGKLRHQQGLYFDLAVIILVTAVAVTSNLVAAVALGILLSVTSFLYRISRSVVRRAYRGDVVHSRRTRDSRQIALLAERGGEIAVFELQGPIFFGTAEKLAAAVDRAAEENARLVILDVRRVTDLDSTGARILLQVNDSLVRQGRSLALSSVDPDGRIAGYLRDMGVTTAITRQRIFRDVDAAIEWAEDRVVFAHFGEIEPGAEYPFNRLDVLSSMSEDEIALLAPALERRTFGKGEIVFREGDEGHELFIITRGSASVKMSLPGADRSTRLVTFAPGTVFGEIALLDTERRSATVEADDAMTCYVLPDGAFRRLSTDHPGVAIKLLTNLGRELSGRLRRANRIIYQLDN